MLVRLFIVCKMKWKTNVEFRHDLIYSICLYIVFFRNMIPSNLIEATFQQVSGLTAHSGLYNTVHWFNVQYPHINRSLCLFSFIPLQYRTDLVPIVQSTDVKESQANYVYVMPDYQNPQLGHPVFLEITPAPDIKYKIVPSTSKGMNVLGIVIFSATMGKTQSSLYRKNISINKQLTLIYLSITIMVLL